MNREIASIVARDYGARRILLQATGSGDDWGLARELVASGAEQVDLLVDPLTQAKLAEAHDGHYDNSKAIRLIFSSHLDFSGAYRLGHSDALVLRTLQCHRDPAESLVRARDFGVRLLCVETTVVKPFRYLDHNGSFTLREGERVLARRLSALERLAFSDYFSKHKIPMPQLNPERAATNEAGEIEFPGMWMWFTTPAAARNLLHRTGWSPRREIQTWKRGALMFFCDRAAAGEW